MHAHAHTQTHRHKHTQSQAHRPQSVLSSFHLLLQTSLSSSLCFSLFPPTPAVYLSVCDYVCEGERALLENHILYCMKKKICFPTLSVCISTQHPPVLSIPQISVLTAEFSQCECVHSLHSSFCLLVPLCVSPSIIISVSAVPYCWEANVIIIFLLSPSPFLSFSLYDSL